MSEPAKSGKRIVSKGAYAKAQGKKAALWMFGTGAGILGIFVIVAAYILAQKVAENHIISVNFGIEGVLSVSFGGCMLIYFGLRSHKQARQVDPGVPLTRANTADLPAPDSLVRASNEPTQTQATVLLRGAAQGQQTPTEQLVRPSAR